MRLLCLILFCLSALRVLGQDPQQAATTCGDINYNREKYEILTSILRNHTMETMCYIMKLEPSRTNKLDKTYKGDDMLEQLTLQMQFGDETVGLTPLLAAVYNGQEDIFAALVTKGAKFENVYNDKGVPLLVLAARRGMISILTVMIDKGFDINVQSRREGHTALIAAIKEEQTDCAIFLIDAKADVTLRGTGLARTALHIAVIHNNLPVVAALLESDRINVNVKDKDGNSPLMLACEKGFEDIALLLISHKSIDVNAQNKDGHTALILSSVKVGGKIKIVEALIDKKADLDIRLRDGRSALVAATMFGHEHIAIKLIEAGSSLDFDAIYSHTALIIACHEGHEQVAKKLLDYGAKTNIQDKQGRTALMMAALKGHTGIVESLLAVKSDEKIKGFPNRKKEVPSVGLKDAKGETAAMLAKSHGFQDCFQLILAREKEHHTKNVKVVNDKILADYDRLNAIAGSRVAAYSQTNDV